MKVLCTADYLQGLGPQRGVGTALKRVVCVNYDCIRCLSKGKWAYSYVFETFHSSRVKASYDLSDYPHPFILKPPLRGNPSITLARRAPLILSSSGSQLKV
ncbi:MAG TPA: hypothetical protein EYP68_08620 [Candidatus Korarchaeota archaeon]|nr:hypothetical protein [Candidatus Korarchaeota archaeon]